MISYSEVRWRVLRPQCMDIPLMEFHFSAYLTVEFLLENEDECGNPRLWPTWFFGHDVSVLARIAENW